jgi:hypothetical protein
MKKLLVILLLITSFAHAQEVLTVNKSGYIPDSKEHHSSNVRINCGCGHTISQSPLYLLRSYGKEYVIDSLGFDPQMISAINVVKGSTEYMKYGAAARYGTVVPTCAA